MPARILVINDTQEILEVFYEILSDEGYYEVYLYSYASHDMTEVERISPDLIIQGHIFGEEKVGWQMLQKLKMRRITATIPVLVCTTAMREVKEMEGYLTAKGVQVIPKPFDLDDLLRGVHCALEAQQRAGARPNGSESALQPPG